MLSAKRPSTRNHIHRNPGPAHDMVVPAVGCVAEENKNAQFKVMKLGESLKLVWGG